MMAYVLVGLVFAAVFLGLPLAWRRFGQPAADRRNAARAEAALAGRADWAYHPDAAAAFADPVPMNLPYTGHRRIRWALSGPLPAAGVRAGAQDRARVVDCSYHQNGRTSSVTDVHVAVLELDRHVSTFELRRDAARGVRLTEAWRPEAAQALVSGPITALLDRESMSVRFFSDRAVAWTSRRLEPAECVPFAEALEELAALLPAEVWEPVTR